MMKKSIYILILICICQIAPAQKSVVQLFNEYRKHESSTRIKVNKGVMALAGLFTDTMGVNGVEVIAFDNSDPGLKDKLSNDIKKLKDDGFETMVQANEGGQSTKVMIRIENEMIKDLVIVTSGNELALIHIKGNIKPSDIEKVTKEHSKHG